MPHDQTSKPFSVPAPRRKGRAELYEQLPVMDEVTTAEVMALFEQKPTQQENKG
ncbi:hypothetical protein [Pseudooctadecabacter jejudonensis]|uniref:Uncharacterized protein n=1 Tax=Pseudooctadecabacter jejudonensis TaxID=1391910 RepID=A0A1Y5SYD3_9RHOB|nr:hypothetical protein [Pseudooctadecabacter jejudonensis]SLN51141.1 hypothetical protein PSJ8397_02675 [Pseudooctadecabacter jejudonensis]